MYCFSWSLATYGAMQILSQTNCSAATSLETQQSSNAEQVPSPNPGHSFTAKSRCSRMIRRFLKAPCVVQDHHSWLIPSYLKHRMVRMRGFSLEGLHCLQLEWREPNIVAQNRCCAFREPKPDEAHPTTGWMSSALRKGNGCFSSWFGQSRSMSGMTKLT